MKRNIILAITSLSIILLDQLSKILIVGRTINIIPNVLSFIYTENTGVAFGLIDDNLVFIILFNIVVLAVIIKFLKENRENMDFIMLVSLILILSGGTSNLIDRFLKGCVVDFIKTEFVKFPIFNLADISVVIGIFILIIVLIKQTMINKNNSKKNNNKII